MHLLDFIKNNSNWEELLSNEPYNIKITRDDGYIMFKYNQIASDFSNEIVRECRGIILRESDFKPVCYPFEKFGNYGESYCPEIDWKNASVQEKIDGSLMKVWYDNKRWHVSTNGTIDAFKAPLNDGKYSSFGELFMAALPFSWEVFVCNLDNNFTYMFELTSPVNRVVIPYENTELYLLGARNMITLKEVNPECLGLSSFKIPKRFPLHSLEEVKTAASELPWDKEGYVVCDENYNRVKIKSPQYIIAHYSRLNGSVSEERMMEVILSGEKAEFLIYASDYADKINELENKYNSCIKEIYSTINRLNPNSFVSRKDYALAVMNEPEWIRPFLFKYDTIDEYIKNVRAYKWVEIFSIDN